LQRNLEGTSFIPMTLVHKMKNLTRMFATFNALKITNTSLYGNVISRIGWANPCLLLRADFFRNGKDAGNSAGTITDVSYLFGKINRLAIEGDVFRHIRGTLQHMSAVFYQLNQPISHNISQWIAGEGYYALTPLDEEWRDTACRNLQPNPSAPNPYKGILGSGNFPHVTLALNAFCANNMDDDPSDPTPYGFGFNTLANALSGYDANYRLPLDNGITQYFPNILRVAGTFEGCHYATGLDGMLFRLPNDFSESPDADLQQATETNVIKY